MAPSEAPNGNTNDVHSETRETRIIGGQTVQVITLKNFDLEEHLFRKMRGTPKGCPIDRLPNELLAYIFELGTSAEQNDEDSDDDGTGDDGWETEEEEVQTGTDEADAGSNSDDDIDMHTSSSMESLDGDVLFQVLVSHVCSRWREVAISTPNIWTHVDFHEPAPFPRCREWLERSKGAPLYIHLDTELDEEVVKDRDNDEDYDSETGDVPNMPFADFATAVSLIVPHIERIRQLDLHVQKYSYMHHALGKLAPASGAPLLRELYLYYHGETDNFSSFTPPELREPLFVLFSGHAPNLRNVTLWGVHLDWFGSLSYLRDLKSFELLYHTADVRPTYKELKAILDSSPTLESLALSLSGPAGATSEDWLGTLTREDIIQAAANGATSAAMIVMPSLTSLSLASLEPDYTIALLEHLTIPALRKLKLDFEDDDFTPLAVALAAPAPGTGGRRSLLAGLHELKMASLPCDNGSMTAFLAQLEQLRSITVNFRFMDQTWLIALACPIGTVIPEHPLLIGEDGPQDVSSDSGEVVALGPIRGLQKSGTEGRGMYCPQLEALTVSGLTGREIRWIVKSRRELGVPLLALFVNEEDDIDQSDVVWMKANVETFDTFEPSDDDAEEVVEIGSDMDDEETGESSDSD